MIQINKEDFEWLRDNVEKHLTTTYYMKYKVATPNQINLQVAEILERTTNKPVEKNFACSTCLFNVYNRMAQIYFENKQEYEAKEEELKKKRQENMQKAREAKQQKQTDNKENNE